MATATATRSSPPSRALLPVGAYDHLFYGGMALAMALTVLVGFGPTYYLRLVGDGPRATVSGGPFTALVHLHGALFTSWIVLFVVQTALVASHRVAVHRRLGIAGAALAAAMVVVGLMTAIRTAARGGAPPGVPPLAFLAIPFFDMVLFASLITAALVWRRDKETHKRLMLLAFISLLAAAVARLPGVLPLGPLAFYGFGYLFIVVAMLYDFGSRRRVHKVYVWGGALMVALVPLRLMISGTAAWQRFAEFLTR
jgi:hypothetical protein